MQQITTIDCPTFKKIMSAGEMNLKKNIETVNALNVFPIPDGDTGDNMHMTFEGGVNAMNSVKSDNLSDMISAAAKGMLLSARGNSGVILSQLFAGVAGSLEKCEYIDAKNLAKSMKSGVDTAYCAVLCPVEGTILTVAREAEQYASGKMSADSTVSSYMTDYIHKAKSTLSKTTEMLDVLKKANVIDSGGAGLVYILEGMCEVDDEEIPESHTEMSVSAPKSLDIDKFDENSEMKFGYCTEILLRLQNSKTDIEKFDISVISDFLKSIGDSVVILRQGTVVKLHVHTFTPEKVLEFCHSYGEFLTLKIENMQLQHNNNCSCSEKPEHKKYALITVANGKGMTQKFKELGADIVIDGGLHMNPSAEDFINAVNSLNADHIFILPNNNNSVMAANQAVNDCDNDVDCKVIPTANIGEGYAAITMFDPAAENAESVAGIMNEAILGVNVSVVAKCVKNTVYDNVSLSQNEYMGFCGKTLKAHDMDFISCALDTFGKTVKDDSVIGIVICGKNAESEKADELKKALESKFSDMEFYLIDGEQELYDLIMIAE